MAGKTNLTAAVVISTFLVALAVSATAVGQIIYVDDDSPADFNNIQAAIDDANDGDTVEIQPGTHTGPGNRDIDFAGKAITVRGTDPNEPNIVAATIIDCNRAGRGFYFHSGEDANSVLDGLTITKGYSPTGAGVYCDNSSPTLRNCIITTNRASGEDLGGGGIACLNSGATIVHCTIVGNGALIRGGGIYCSDSRLTIGNCTVMWNRPLGAVYYIVGAGIYSTNSILTITDCNISENPFRQPGWSAANGGGIHLEGGAAVFTDCTMNQNKSDRKGGAISCESGNSTVMTNCLFSNNSSDWGGGAISCESGSSPTITNCLFTHNSAGGGGAIYLRQNASSISHCVFRKNVVYHGFGGGIYCSTGSELTINNCLFDGCSAERGGALRGFRSSITLTNCLFLGNSALRPGFDNYGGAVACSLGNMTAANCLFAANSAIVGGAVFSMESILTLANCTFADNSAHWANTLYTDYGPSIIHTRDSIIWDGPDSIHNQDESTLLFTFCDIPGLWPGYGNIDADPCFVALGYWDPNGTPDDWKDDFWVDGDYHLKSQVGRWKPATQAWIVDDVTSPCIDAGDMTSPIGYEPFPNGGIINMGAYGGTAEASKSYFGEPVCETIVAGDINGDCKVNYKDFALIAAHWLRDENP